MSPDEVSNAELARWMMRVEAKIDLLAQDHEDRLRALEKAVWIATGLGGAALTSGVGAIVQGLVG
jgi:hypothetical protein